MTHDDPRHGTLGGYGTGCRCVPCRNARYTWTKRYTAEFKKGRRRTRDATGTIRRIHALQALGWALPDIAVLGGWNSYQAVQQITQQKRVSPKMAARIDAVYRQLCMRIPATTPASKRAKTWAAKHGYVPPLAWSDIDDPHEQPTGIELSRDHLKQTTIDRVVVDRRLDGHKTRKLTQAETLEVLRQGIARGLNGKDLERRGINYHRYKDAS